MNARDLLRDCRERSVLIRNDGGALLVKPIRGDLPTDIRARLVAQKPAVLKALADPAPKCSGCGVRLGQPGLCYWCRKVPRLASGVNRPTGKARGNSANRTIPHQAERAA